MVKKISPESIKKEIEEIAALRKISITDLLLSGELRITRKQVREIISIFNLSLNPASVPSMSIKAIKLEKEFDDFNDFDFCE